MQSINNGLYEIVTYLPIRVIERNNVKFEQGKVDWHKCIGTGV